MYALQILALTSATVAHSVTARSQAFETVFRQYFSDLGKAHVPFDVSLMSTDQKCKGAKQKEGNWTPPSFANCVEIFRAWTFLKGVRLTRGGKPKYHVQTQGTAELLAARISQRMLDSLVFRISRPWQSVCPCCSPVPFAVLARGSVKEGSRGQEPRLRD